MTTIVNGDELVTQSVFLKDVREAPPRSGGGREFRSMRGEVLWTEERVALLKKLWAEGETAVAIAARLRGLSRSAVLGKIFRLRLPATETAGGKREQRGAAAAVAEGAETPVWRHRRPHRARSAQPTPPRRRRGKALLELTNSTCRWPHGRPGSERFFFCGAPEADLEHGIPYCPRHMRIAYAVPTLTVAHDRPRRAVPGSVPAAEAILD
jgi:GcrA cell cycle regulator